MIELRGITIDSPSGVKRVRLITRSERGDDYQTLEYPVGLKITRGAIVKFLAKEMSVGAADVIIAPHVKIPEVITSPIKRKAR